MPYYYIKTTGGRQTCIKIHSNYPLPHGITANCADDLTLPSNLQYVGPGNVPCDSGGSVATDVYTENFAVTDGLAKAALVKKSVPKKKAAKKKAAKKKPAQKRKAASPKKKTPARKKRTAPRKKNPAKRSPKKGKK